MINCDADITTMHQVFKFHPYL